MRLDRRVAKRKSTVCIDVQDLTTVTTYKVIATKGQILNASTTGFLMELDRNDILPSELRDNLSLESCLGQQVCLYLPQMNLDLDGTITRARHRGKGKFEVAIDFSYDVPDYWRECLIDLLPSQHEMEQILEEEEEED